MTTKIIAFRADRSAVPQRINIGFETDNLVERLAFKLPTIHPRQTVALMLGGRQPNMILLTQAEGQYYVDLTAEIVGAAGMASSYVTINTPDGRVWNSGPFMLATGDLPDVDGEIQEHFPDAIEQMRQEIAEHRADMDDKAAAVENAAERAEDAAQRAEDAAAGITPGGGGGGITEEADPTVPDWAKQPLKPTYTAEEVGAQPKGDYALRSEIPAVPVKSVNGKTGEVKLNAADVGALPDSTPIPTVPTNLSAFENDVGYLTEHQDLSAYAKKSELPDTSAFITRTVDDLVNYYRKSESYTRDEIDQKISTIPKFSISVVDSLPVTGISDTTIYLLRNGVDGNLYTEYIFVSGAWEILGSQRVDLTGYATETWVGTQLAGYQPKGDYALRSELPSVPTKLSELEQDSAHRLTTDAEKAAWNAKSNFSGKYDDLDGKPTIPTVPTKVSAFDNDAEYLTEVPAEYITETELVKKGYLTEHQDISHKLDAAKLPEAINDALAQAKASGEFDGKDGTSVTVSSVAESTEDGGSNVVTFSDGKYLTVRNGRQGSDANVTTANIKSALGYTPASESAVEQLSEEIVDNYVKINQGISNAGKILIVDANGNLSLADVPVAGESGDISGVVGENMVITLTGDLPEGNYTLVYRMEDGTILPAGELALSSEYDIPLTLTLGKIDYDNNGAIVASDTYLYSNMITRDPNTKYTMSLIGEGAYNSVRVVYYDADGNYLGISEYINGFANAMETGAWNLPMSSEAKQFRLRIYHNTSDANRLAATRANTRLTKRKLSYTNVLPTALDTAGAVLDGVGYRDGYTPGSYPNRYREAAGMFQTGFFPYTSQQAKDRVPIYVKGVTIDLTNLASYGDTLCANMSPEYNTTDWIGHVAITDITSINQMTITQLGESYYMFRPNSNYYSTNGWYDKGIKYMHMGLPGSGAGVIITVDEPIE